MIKKHFLVYASVLCLAGLVLFLVFSGEAPREELFLYCGAGLRPVMEDLSEAFTQKTGIGLVVDYGPSSMLLGRVRVIGEGDLFMPGDEFYTMEAAGDGLIFETRTAAVFVPVIMVGKENPLGITGIADLAGKSLRLGLADERSAAVGRISRLIFEKNGIPREKIKSNLVFESATVNELASNVSLGHIDAAIVWEPVALRFAEAGYVSIPDEQNIVSNIPVSVLAFSGRKEKALKFLDFAVSEEARGIFLEHNYREAGYVEK